MQEIGKLSDNAELVRERVNGGLCPYCGAEAIMGDREWADGDMWEEMSCPNDHDWHEVYKLAIVEDREVTDQVFFYELKPL
jgi:hypothetical protein